MSIIPEPDRLICWFIPDVLQQPTLDGRQGGLLLEPRAQDRPRSPGQLVSGHPQRPQRAAQQQLRERADPRPRAQ